MKLRRGRPSPRFRWGLTAAAVLLLAAAVSTGTRTDRSPGPLFLAALVLGVWAWRAHRRH